MGLFTKFRKEISKMDGVGTGDGIPKFWINTGSYVLNKIISGKYDRGIPQGRLTALTGPSGCGKSFVLGNIIRSAQQSGCGVLLIDSENALDFNFLRAIGVDVTAEDFIRVTTNEVNNCLKTINIMLSDYRDAAKNGIEMKRLLICIDSLDFLFLGHALEAYEKTGELNNDQGLHAKKLKQLLVTLMQDIQEMPVSIVATKQVYTDQTQHAFPPVKMTESLKFPFSQIILFTRYFERDTKTKSIDSIRMKAFGWKVRFTKPFQQVELVVPYDTGLDPYDGIFAAAASLGIVTKSGSWYQYKGKNFYLKDAGPYQEEILQALIARENESLCVELEGVEDLPVSSPEDLKRQKLEEMMLKD